MKKLLIVKGTLCLENIDLDKIYENGGEIGIVEEKDIPGLTQGMGIINAKVVGKSTLYRNVQIQDDVQFSFYATEAIYVNKELYASKAQTMMSRSATPNYEAVAALIEYDIPTLYVTTNSVINAPVNIADPYNLMGVGKLVRPDGTSVYDLAYICGNTHGKINEWSKEKPIRVGTPQEPTKAQKNAALRGMDIFITDSYISAANNGKSNSTWGYLPPRVNVDFSRLTDFELYNHEAVPQFSYGKIGDLTMARKPAEDVMLEFYWNKVDETSLDFLELTIDGVALGEYYLAILIVDSNGNLIKGCCDYTKIKDVQFDNLFKAYKTRITIQRTGDTNMPADEFYMIPVLSSIQRYNSRFDLSDQYVSSWSGGKFVSVPLSKGKLTIGVTNLKALAYFLHDDNGNRVSIRVFYYYDNAGSKEITVNNVPIYASIESRDYPGQYDRYFEKEKTFVLYPNKSNLLEGQGIDEITERELNNKEFRTDIWYIEIIPPLEGGLNSVLVRVLENKPTGDPPFRNEYGDIPDEWYTDK